MNRAHRYHPSMASLLSRAGLQTIQPPYRRAAEQLYYRLHEKEDGYLPSARDDLRDALAETYTPEEAKAAVIRLKQVMRDSLASKETIYTSLHGVSLIGYMKGLARAGEVLREVDETNRQNGGPSR